MSAAALKKDLVGKGLVPGELKAPIESSGRLPNLKKGDVLHTLTNKDLQALLGKGKFPCSLDLSSQFFELDNDQFLSACRDVLKDLCLSNNPLKEIVSADHLTKLKVLVANGCRLQTVSVNKLESLEFLSLADNMLTSVPKMSNLQKLVNVDLSGNPLSIGFEEFESVKSLQVIDLARTGLDVSIAQFYQFLLNPFKKLPKLTHISFAENPIEVSIIKFRLFVIFELSKLKYLDWCAVSKEDRAESLKQEKLWKEDKMQPAAPLKVPVLVSRATRIGANRGGAGGNSNNQVLGPDDKALVNFLLGDEGKKETKSKDSMLDDFLHETTADPLNDIMSFLGTDNKETKPQGGDDYEDELMRIIYGDKATEKQQQQKREQQHLAPQEDEMISLADLDGMLAAPVKPVSSQQQAQSVADQNLDDLLNSIIAVESNASAGGNVAILKKPSGIDLLLQQEEELKKKRLEEERQRVEQERLRLEKERAELEIEKKKELEREKARLRAEMEAQKQREIDEARLKAAQSKPGKSTQAIEDEALAMLELMEDVANAAPVAGTASRNTQEQEADDLLASIDALVAPSGGPVKPAAAVKPVSPPPVKTATAPKQVFGPRSTAAKTPSNSGALPIARRRADDDDLDSLLSEARAPEVKKADVGKVAPWIAYWSQLNFGDRLGIGTLGITSVGWVRSAECTIKKLKLQRFSDEFLAKYQEEVPLLVTLQHPNIVRFLGVCVDDTLCTIQQYIRGCNLFGYLRNEGNLVDLPFITATSRGIASGIAYLHARKIIHRNLHSKNVILDGDMTPKLRDYGMQFVKQETYQLAIGPVVYEAPELLSRLPYTESVDAYSFGILLWEIFCRELPHKQLQPVAIKEQVLGAELRPDITPDIPVVFRRLMSACWNSDATRRPSFTVIGKILNKSAEELGSYGTEGAAQMSFQPKVLGPAAAKVQPGVDLVAQLNTAPEVDSTTVLMDKIVSLLESPDRLTQQRGLRVTYNLCEKPEYKDSLSLMKAIVPALIQKAKSGHEKGTRELALQALSKLCVEDANAEEFLACLGYPVLLAALDSLDVALEMASSMLLVVLLKNARNRDAFVSVKATPVVVKLLLSETENVKTNAVWATSLALENEQTQQKFVEEGGVPILLRLAQSSNPGVVLRVLVSVGLLLTNPSVFNELKDSGIIQRFLRLLSSPSPLLQKHGIEAIVRFGAHFELREALYRAQAIPSLLEVIASSDDVAIKKQAVIALSCFLDDDEQALYIEESQALRPVVRLMVSSDADLRMEALKLISKSASVPELRAQLLSIGAIAPLVQMLSVQDRSLRLVVLYSVCVASEDLSVSIAVANADGAAQLVRLCDANIDDSDVLELATETLANVARSAQGVAAMRECSAFPLLIRLLVHSNSKVVEGAANAVVQASANAEGRLTVLALDGVYKLLVLMLQSTDEALKESILWSCPNWCSEQSSMQIVASVALPYVVSALEDPKENIQSIAVKTLLLLCASGSCQGQLNASKAKEKLSNLERNSANPTLKVAAAKALSFFK